jgi:hypothetical protein
VAAASCFWETDPPFGRHLLKFLLECFELGGALSGEALGELQARAQLCVVTEELLRGVQAGGHGAKVYRAHRSSEYKQSLNANNQLT